MQNHPVTFSKLFFWIIPVIIAITSVTYIYNPPILTNITTLVTEQLHNNKDFSSISHMLGRAIGSATKYTTAAARNIMSKAATTHRPVRKIFYAHEQAEGDGARVRRSIGTPALKNFSPFLMFDHFDSNSPNGFPDHPHRGQETITYLLQGGMDHEDFTGNKGTLHTGDLQFMTAGRGIVHAEMPHVHDDGTTNIGFQLWVDLPTELKDCEPRYRDLRAKEIPVVTTDNDKVIIKVISGQSHGVDSVKDLAYTPVWIFDIEIKPGGKVTQSLPQGWNAFAYVLRGGLTTGQGDKLQKVDEFNICAFEPEGDEVHFEVDQASAQGAHLMLIAGTPLDQPVLQYGPFVVTSKEGVYKAMVDFQSHANGFERAKDWKSEIGNKARVY